MWLSNVDANLDFEQGFLNGKRAEQWYNWEKKDVWNRKNSLNFSANTYYSGKAPLIVSSK